MRSLRMKMVMIMVILILALMLTTGAFLMSGVGNFYGAFLGGILLGVAETFAGAYIGSASKEALGYIVIVLVLVFRPNGLLGKKKVEKV